MKRMSYLNKENMITVTVCIHTETVYCYEIKCMTARSLINRTSDNHIKNMALLK